MSEPSEQAYIAGARKKVGIYVTGSGADGAWVAVNDHNEKSSVEDIEHGEGFEIFVTLEEAEAAQQRLDEIVVTDEMADAALEAWYGLAYVIYPEDVKSDRFDMKEAIEAALRAQRKA